MAKAFPRDIKRCRFSEPFDGEVYGLEIVRRAVPWRLSSLYDRQLATRCLRRASVLHLMPVAVGDGGEAVVGAAIE